VGQWAQKTPRKEATTGGAGGDTATGSADGASADDKPAGGAVARSSMSVRREVALALIQKPLPQDNSINTPAEGSGAQTTTLNASGSSSSGLNLQNSSATTTNTNKLLPPSGGNGFRGSISVAGAQTSLMTSGADHESSSAEVDTEFSEASDALGDSGIHTTGPMFKKKRFSHSQNHHLGAGGNGDSPVHAPGERRGSAVNTDIPASIAEVSKSANENEASSHLADGVRTTLSTPKPDSSGLLSPTSELRRKESLAEKKNGPMWDSLKHLADQSLIAFLSTIKQVAITQELAHWRSNELMRKLLGAPPMGDYEVDMGFGLHVGWAIEGAIGSIYKIDASYLSPNVNIASRLSV
jgi:hypothetical protein